MKSYFFSRVPAVQRRRTKNLPQAVAPSPRGLGLRPYGPRGRIFNSSPLAAGPGFSCLLRFYPPLRESIPAGVKIDAKLEPLLHRIGKDNRHIIHKKESLIYLQMILSVNNQEYQLSSSCEVTSSGPYVIVDGISSSSFTSSIPEWMQTKRLLLLFDKTRTARWFEQVILEGLASKAAGLTISKTIQWDNNYPFGFKYTIY